MAVTYTPIGIIFLHLDEMYGHAGANPNHHMIDPTEVRDLSLPRGGVASTPGDDDVKKKNPEKNRVASTLGVDDNVMKNPEKNLEKNGNTGSDSGTVRKAESSSLSVQVRSSQIPRLTTTAIVSRSSQPLSPMRSVLSTVCCQLGEFSDVECPSD